MLIWEVSNFSIVPEEIKFVVAEIIFTTKGGEISSCIFINNTSPTGPVLYSESGGVVIHDSIMVNNKATSNGYIVSTDAYNKITADNNWWGNTLNNQKTRPSAYPGVFLRHWY